MKKFSVILLAAAFMFGSAKIICENKYFAGLSK